MLVQVETARSAAWHAAWCTDFDRDQRGVAAVVGLLSYYDDHSLAIVTEATPRHAICARGPMPVPPEVSTTRAPSATAARIAARKSQDAAEAAGETGMLTKGSVVASDAFFPFADGLLSAVEAGATAVIQPGGSMRDAEVIAAADEAGIAMVFTGMRHFRH